MSSVYLSVELKATASGFLCLCTSLCMYSALYNKEICLLTMDRNCYLWGVRRYEVKAKHSQMLFILNNVLYQAGICVDPNLNVYLQNIATIPLFVCLLNAISNLQIYLHYK